MAPGPIAINAATFVGTRLAGVPGALTATPGCILPSCLLLTLLSRLYLRYRQCHQLKTGAFVLCEKTAKQMQLVGAGLCSARQDTPNYRKSSANPYALTRLAVEADAGHSRSRRRSVTDVGLPLAGTHRPGRMHRFYGNLRRICNFSMGRQSRRPLQQPFALSVGADDSVRPRDVPILRESSANSQLPPTSKEVTACGFAANSRRNSLHSAGRSRAPPLPTAVAFQRFLRKTNRLWS